MICVCNTYIHHTSWFFPIGYHLILSYRTTVQTYKHCQLANILPSHAGSWSGPGKNISSQKHRWTTTFPFKQKTWVVLFFCQKIYSSELNFPNTKKYGGQFWERANTSFHDLCAFFLREFGAPFPRDANGDILEMINICGLRSRDIPHCS